MAGGRPVQEKTGQATVKPAPSSVAIVEEMDAKGEVHGQRLARLGVGSRRT